MDAEFRRRTRYGMDGCPQEAIAVSPRSHSPSLRALLVAGMVLLAAACAPVGPNYVRPSAPVPAAFKEAGTQGAQQAIASKWWEIYGDATLNELVSQVAVNNQSLLAAAARMRQAQALVQVAKGASMPEVGVGSLK